MTSDSTESLDHGLIDHSGFKHGHFHHPFESRYSGSESENHWRDTQGSISKGTSINLGGRASTVSTQSISLEEYKDVYANATTGRMYAFNDVPRDRM